MEESTQFHARRRFTHGAGGRWTHGFCRKESADQQFFYAANRMLFFQKYRAIAGFMGMNDFTG